MGVADDHHEEAETAAGCGHNHPHDYPHSQKRKRNQLEQSTTRGNVNVNANATPRPYRHSRINLAGEDDDAYDDDAEVALLNEPLKKIAKKRTPKKKGPEEPTEAKRLRRFRPRAPTSFDDVYLRATTQRFYVLSRTRCGTADCPEEMVELTGSTGNIYNICIAKQPTCDCPQGTAGNQCKHIVYVMSRVLRARYEHVYQLALLSTELQDIFTNAPPPMGDSDAASTASNDKNRKPIDGDCPICFSEMDPIKEAVVWCKAACGQNIHKECFSMWAATKRQNVGRDAEVTCPFCRSQWQGDEDMVAKIKKSGPLNDEGYVNVADQLGISTERDISTYSRFWRGHPNAYRRRGDWVGPRY